MGFHAFVREPGGRGDWYVDPAYNRRGTTAHLSYSLRRPAGSRAAPRRARSTAHRATRRRAGAGRATEPARRSSSATLPPRADHRPVLRRLLRHRERAGREGHADQPGQPDLQRRPRHPSCGWSTTPTSSTSTPTPRPPAPTARAARAPCFDRWTTRATPDDRRPARLLRRPTLGQNRTVLGQLIGASNYDVGHIALGNNGGGIAYLGVVGGDYKGGGCTGLPAAAGRLLRHRLRRARDRPPVRRQPHLQRRRRHCGGNISEASVEPGSGSSVMAYAGICGQDDLQPHTDPYFSPATIDEVDAYTGTRPYRSTEVQTVSLRGFDTDGEPFTLTYRRPTTAIRHPRRRLHRRRHRGGRRGAHRPRRHDRGWGYDEFDPTSDDPARRARRHRLPGDLQRGAATLEVDGADVDLPSLDGDQRVGRRGRLRRRDRPGRPGSTTAAAATSRPPATTRPRSTAPGGQDDPDPHAVRADRLGHGRRRRRADLPVGADRPRRQGTRLADNTKVNGPLFRVFGDDARGHRRGHAEVAVARPSTSPTATRPGSSPTWPRCSHGNTNAGDRPCPDVPPLPDDRTLRARHGARLLLGVPADRGLPRQRRRRRPASCTSGSPPATSSPTAAASPTTTSR